MVYDLFWSSVMSWPQQVKHSGQPPEWDREQTGREKAVEMRTGGDKDSKIHSQSLQWANRLLQGNKFTIMESQNGVGWMDLEDHLIPTLIMFQPLSLMLNY